MIQFDYLLQLVQCVGGVLEHLYTELFAHGHDVVVPHTAKWLGVLFERQAGCAPFFEQFWQRVRRLAPYYKESGI